MEFAGGQDEAVTGSHYADREKARSSTMHSPGPGLEPLDHAIEQLTSRLYSLFSRIEPVLNPVLPQPSSEEALAIAIGPPSPLRERVERLHRMSGELSDILERLDL